MPDLAFFMLRRTDVDIALWLHTSNEPSDAEWDPGVAQLDELKRTRQGDISRLRGLVITDGGRPNPRQNKRLVQAFDGKAVKSAVVTTVLRNPFMKGIATVMQWTNPGLKFFEPPLVRTALAHVDAASDEAVVWAEFQRLQRIVAPVATMELIAKVLVQAQKPAV
jgi:hypothetical protein